MPLRVRQVLDQIGGNGRRGLNKYLPEYNLPANTKGLFPNAILSSYSFNKHIEVGLITERFVLSSEPLTKQIIVNSLTHISDNELTKDKIVKSKTTTDYINKIEKTKQKLNEFLLGLGLSLENALFDQEFQGTNIVGHPDAVIGSVAIEVKTTSKLDTDHPYFIQQLSAYIALNPSINYGLLVLPLQESIIIIDGTKWVNRTKYLQAIEEKAAKIIAASPTISMTDLFNVESLIQFYAIGKHIHKEKTLLDTAVNMHPNVPYQIFIGGNMNSNLNIKEDDILAASQYIKNNNINLYIHAPYIINLAAKTNDDWNIKYMHKTMKYGSQLGAKGVVVHVGKSTDQPYVEAYEQMSDAVSRILEHTDPLCPLLIETPAGQGSEMLKNKDDFLTFIQQFSEQDRIGACVDTCHVFACGYKPSEYLKFIGDNGLLKLVHYNDSNDTCGSCKDRHAFVGSGHIGLPEMTSVADYCGANGIPMVIE